MIFILIVSKGLNSAKNVDELYFFFSLHHLVTPVICTKFRENILDGIKVMEQTQFHGKKLKGALFRKKM